MTDLIQISTFSEFVLNHFDQVYVINLDSRPDRMKQVNELLSQYKINYKRISGVYLKDKYTAYHPETKTSYIIGQPSVTFID